MVISNLLIESMEALVLFDSEATHSFCSPILAQRMGKLEGTLDSPLRVVTPLGKVIEVMVIYKECKVIIGTQALPANLILLDMVNFNTILGMDWLANHHATLDY